jgi:hypothetical protein
VQSNRAALEQAHPLLRSARMITFDVPQIQTDNAELAQLICFYNHLRGLRMAGNLYRVGTAIRVKLQSSRVPTVLSKWG